jgi:hypothetical protein
MTAREQIANDKPLGAFVSSVVNNPLYDKLELVLQAAIAAWARDGNPHVGDRMTGAMEILDILRTIAIAPEPEPKAPSSGVEHNFVKSKP